MLSPTAQSAPWRSSYWMRDPDFVYDEIGLKNGDFFLDLGWGAGNYSLRASMIVGDGGIVYALDKWKYLLDDLTKVDHSVKVVLCR